MYELYITTFLTNTITNITKKETFTMKHRKFNKEKQEELAATQKKEKKRSVKPQRSYQCFGTAMVVPINNRKHKILATALFDGENNEENPESYLITLSIAKETGDMPIWHQFEDNLHITAKRYQLRTAILSKIIELETAGEFDIHISSVDSVYTLLENAGDYLCGQASVEEVLVK